MTESPIPPINPKKNKKENFFSEWLEQLQQESWQLELLISGLALFGIWESKGMLYRLDYYFDVNVINDYSGYTNILMLVLWSGWAIFLTNLLIHIIVRGLWIGAIGLRYVSGDIDFDTLNYSEIFIKYYKRKIGSFDNYIERLEKMSSVLFSFTFLLFFMFISFAAFNLAFVLFSRLLSLISDESISSSAIGLVAVAYYGIGLLVLVDFFTLGAFKKVKDKGFSRVYFWIYRFYSAISLSFIFRPLLLNFIDNSYTRRLFYFAIPYALFILVGLRGTFFEKNIYIPSFNPNVEYSNIIGKNTINWIYYDDLRDEHINSFNTGNDLPEKTKISHLSLDQYENDDNSLAIFLEFVSRDDEHIQEALNTSPFRKNGIGHKVFARGREDDPGMIKIDSSYLIKINLMKDVIGTPEKEISPALRTAYGDEISIWKNNTKDDISRLREELRSDLRAQKNNYMEIKISSIKKEILKMHTFKFDKVNVDPVESYFMIHPNMHEQGVMCYFPLDSLSAGGHMLEVTKQRIREGCENGCAPSYFSIPFRKI